MSSVQKSEKGGQGLKSPAAAETQARHVEANKEAAKKFNVVIAGSESSQANRARQQLEQQHGLTPDEINQAIARQQGRDPSVPNYRQNETRPSVQETQTRVHHTVKLQENLPISATSQKTHQQKKIQLQENLGIGPIAETSKSSKPQITKTTFEQRVDEFPERQDVPTEKEFRQSKIKSTVLDDTRFQSLPKEHQDFLSSSINQGAEFLEVGIENPRTGQVNRVQRVPIERAYDVLAENPNASFTATPNYLTIRKEQKEFVSSLKDSGFKSILVVKRDDSGDITSREVVPIDYAYRAIVKNPDASFVAIPVVPDNALIVGPKTFLTIEEEKPRQTVDYDPVSKLTKSLHEYDTGKVAIGPPTPNALKSPSNLAKESLAAGGAEALSTLTSTRNFLETQFEKTFKRPFLLGDPAYVPETGPGVAVGSPVSAALDSKNVTEFADKTVKGWEQLPKLVEEQGVHRVAAQSVVFVSPFTPSKYLPVKMRVIQVPTGNDKIATTYRGIKFGWGSGGTHIGVSNNRLVAGLPNYKQAGFDKLAIQQERGLEVATQSKFGREVLEKAKSELASNKKLSEAEYRKLELLDKIDDELVNTKFVEQKKLPDQPIANLQKGPETDEAFAFISKRQAKGKQPPGKGSLIEATSSAKGDLVRQPQDFDIHIPKEKPAIREQSKFLEDVRANPGRAFAKDGTNVLVGDFTGKYYYKLPKMELSVDQTLHGTSRASARDIVEEGVRVDASQRKSGFFTATRAKLAKGFASRSAFQSNDIPAFVLSKLKTDQILRFKDLPPEVQQQVASKNWLEFQTKLSQYGEARGFKAVEKPYKSLDPNAKVTEVIILDADIIKSAKVVKGVEAIPALKNAKTAINIVTDKDEAGGYALSMHDKNKVFGRKYTKDYFTAFTKDGYPIKLFKRQYQVLAKTASIASMQSKESLAKAGMSTKQINELTKDSEFIIYPAAFRAQKDIVDKYYQIGSAINVARKSKDFEKVKVLKNYQKELKSAFKHIDYTNYTPEISFDGITKSESTFSKFASTGSKGSPSALAIPHSTTGKTSSTLSPTKQKSSINSQYQNYLDKSFLSTGSKSSSKGNKSNSSKSSKSNSSFGKSSMFSYGKSSKSVYGKSTKSVYNYPKSTKSVKSSASKSGLSTGSTPSIITKSVGSPGKSSFKYSKFTSTGSYSTFLAKFGTLRVKVPPIKPMAGLLKFGQGTQKYTLKEGPTDTFVWQVKNPLAPGFSILEGRTDNPKARKSRMKLF